jgi:hypothetical protein
LPEEESAKEQLTEEIIKKCQQDKISNFQGTPSRMRAVLEKAYAFFDKKSLQEICPSAEVFFHRGMPSVNQMEQGVEGLNTRLRIAVPKAFLVFRINPARPLCY